MSINSQLVESIKRNFAEQTSDELRKIIEKRDLGSYSEEAFIAAQAVLDDRARGGSKEPLPKPPPPSPPTPAELEAAEDALLRRQIRLIGLYYYFLAFLSIIPALAFVVGRGSFQSVSFELIIALAIPGVFLAIVGWGLRRLHPMARLIGLMIAILHVPAFPVGTVIGLYCFDKLVRADKLFGGGRHPGER